MLGKEVYQINDLTCYHIYMNKVLIIEDEPSFRKALTKKLSSEFDIIEAKNGTEGLSMALEQHPDLILLDVGLPEMDGISMLKELRQDDWGKAIKVVILTNLTDGTKLADALEQGAYDYLIKSDRKIEDITELIRNRLQ